MKLGINITSPNYWSGAWIFNDPMLLCGVGVTHATNAWNMGGVSPPSDPQGYPIVLDPKPPLSRQPFTKTRTAAGHYPGGDFLVTWDGDGILRFGGDVIKSAAISTQSCVISVAPAGQGIIVYIVRSSPCDPIRNLRMVPASQQAAPSRFDPKYLADFAAFPGPIRFKNWQQTNGFPRSGWTRWGDRATQYGTQCGVVQPVLDESGTPLLAPDGTPYYAGGGVALEYQIELCNTLKRDGWWCIPHLATDAYASAMARMIRDRLDPSLKVYVEVGNEIWNWQYWDTGHAWDLGVAAGVDPKTGSPLVVGKPLLLRRLFEAFDAGWGADDSRVLRVLADSVWGGGKFEPFMLQFQSLGYTKIDAFAGAPYFYLGPKITDNYTADTPLSQVVADCSAFIAADVTQSMAAMKAHRDKWQTTLDRPIEICAYEWGNELITKPGLVCNAQFTALQTDPAMQGLYDQLMRAMADNGVTMACYYVDLYPTCYGARTYQDDPWTLPKAAALAAWQNS